MLTKNRGIALPTPRQTVVYFFKKSAISSANFAASSSDTVTEIGFDKSSVSIPIMDFAFAVYVPDVARICDSYLFASATNSDTRRVFGRVISYVTFHISLTRIIIFIHATA